MAGSSPARICSARKISTTQNSAHAAAATGKPTFRESEPRRSVTGITAPVIGPVVAIAITTAVVVKAVVIAAVIEPVVAIATATAVVVKAVVIAADIEPVVAIATPTAVVSPAAAASTAAVVVLVAHNGRRRGRGVTRANDRGANLALAGRRGGGRLRLATGCQGYGGQRRQGGQRAACCDACAVEEHAARLARDPPSALEATVKPLQSLVPTRTSTATFDRMATRILIVEDEASIAEPFARLLRREGFETTVARTAKEALDAARTTEPDLVLLDLALPDGDGRDVCRVLRSEREVPVIMVTARGTETDRVVGLELGADDYVVKPFSGAEVVARIRAVLRRATRATAPSTPQEPIRVHELDVDLAARRAVLAGRELELSRKEFDLLAELVRHAGRVVTREDLMSRVWDENWFGSTKTLDVHMGWLRRKLGDEAAAPRYIHTVGGVGFRFSGTDGAVP
jgi:two-component system response regulator RegX3